MHGGVCEVVLSHHFRVSIIFWEGTFWQSLQACIDMSVGGMIRSSIQAG